MCTKAGTLPSRDKRLHSALCYHSPVAAAPAKENNATQIP